MIFYIAGALHGSSNLEIARRLYDETAKILGEVGVSTYLPHRKTDPMWEADMSSAMVFKRDLEAIRNASAVVAYLNEPSHGVGAEVALCIKWDKPIFALLKRERKCSRFLEGLLKTHGQDIVRYSDMPSLVPPLRKFIDSVGKINGIGDTSYTIPDRA